MENTIFILTGEQAKLICEFYDENPYLMSEGDIHRLLDRLIDDVIYYGLDK